MPIIYLFSKHCTEVKTVSIEKLPCTVFTDERGVLEIDKKNDDYVVGCNKKFLLNNNKIFFSALNHNDLMVINDQFVLFDQHANNIPDNFYLGKFNLQEETAFLFSLPPKVKITCFDDIHSIIKPYYCRKKLYIDCASVRYMDSVTLSGMLNLIKKAGSEQCIVYFYMVSDKFNTYLKLANIKNKCCMLQTSNHLIDYFLKKKRTQHAYILSNTERNCSIDPKKALLVGRTEKICRLHLHEESVSRFHAALIQLDDNIFIIDCDSKNQTLVNDQSIPPFKLYRLKTLDQITFANQPSFTLQENTIG